MDYELTAEDIDGLKSLAELFSEADAIGNKYQDAETVAEYQAEVQRLADECYGDNQQHQDSVKPE